MRWAAGEEISGVKVSMAKGEEEPGNFMEAATSEKKIVPEAIFKLFSPDIPSLSDQRKKGEDEIW